MKINKRDWLFIGLIAIVVAIFVAISGKEKTKPVPLDEVHRIVYQTANAKAPGPNASIFERAFYRPDKKAAETYCIPCHEQKGVAYPPNHPSKNRCLFCHKLQKS